VRSNRFRKRPPFHDIICAIAQMSGIESTSRRIGQRVRDERRRQGMDQRTLALVANVGVRSIHRVEHGEPTVRLDILLRVLAALGLGLDVHGRGET
jgi:HTH-type transcriptional regulator / antitoxin HipB